jgi:VIT1/CCC1 family predicted Fe2+/Mn2+ transporter
MASGEFVSVHAQEDTEVADLAQPLADQVAAQLTAHDALVAHARDELGLLDLTAARPTQAALASAASVSVGAVLPIVVVALALTAYLLAWVALAALVFLAALGAVSAQLGGAPLWRGAWRVTWWGALAMAVTAGAGAVFGAVA